KNTILIMLDSGCSAYTMATTTDLNVSTLSKLHVKKHSDLQKSNGDRPFKLSPVD
ncbi:hypothetical protein BDN67DRAFT_881530, partial [Paxillus ammoniavirescens]